MQWFRISESRNAVKPFLKRSSGPVQRVFWILGPVFGLLVSPIYQGNSSWKYLQTMATLRSPGLKVKLLVGPTCKIPRSTQRSCSGIRRSPIRCAMTFSSWFFRVTWFWEGNKKLQKTQEPTANNKKYHEISRSTWMTKINIHTWNSKHPF